MLNQKNETAESRKRGKKRRYLLLLLLLLILIIVGRCGAERHRVRTDFNKSVSEFECALDSINSVTDIEQVAELLLKLIDYEQYDYVECCPSEYRKQLADTLIVKGDRLARGGIFADAVAYYKYALEFDNSEMATKRIEACEGLQTASNLIGEEKFAEAKNLLANMLADSAVFGDIVKTLTDKCVDGNKLAETIARKVRDIQQKPDFDGYIERAFDANIEMVFVKGGSFKTVRIAFLSDNTHSYPYDGDIDDFYIGRYEITQEQWEKVMGTTLSQERQLAHVNHKKYQEYLDKKYKMFFDTIACCNVFEVGSNYPMAFVDWNDAMEFCRRLSQQSGKKYILPNEIQWQYAATGGIHEEKYKYSGSDNLDEVGWYNKNSGGKPHPVGQKRSNALGIYDMCGNVSELDLRKWRSYTSNNTWQECDDSDTDCLYSTMGCCFMGPEKYCLIRVVEGGSGKSKNTGFRICMIP